MSWSEGQHDGKLHLWGIHSDQATWGSTVDSLGCEDGQRVFTMSSQVPWRCAPNVLPLDLRTVLPGHDQQSHPRPPGRDSNHHPSDCRLQFIPPCLQDLQ